MKNFTLFIVFLLLVTSTAIAQETTKKETRTNQYDVLNDVYVAYGFGSVFYFVDQNSNWSYTSAGSFILGYTRSLNRVIGVGFQMCFTPVTATYNLSATGNESKTDNYAQALARVKFQYLNTPTFGMYSGIAMGVTLDYKQETSSNGKTTKSQKLLPAGQLTLLGFRLGRGAAFMGEFGIGTISILNLGFSYKFGN